MGIVGVAVAYSNAVGLLDEYFGVLFDVGGLVVGLSLAEIYINILSGIVEPGT